MLNAECRMPTTECQLSGDSHAELGSDIGDGFEGAIKVFARMGGGNLAAKASVPLRNHREAEPGYVDSPIQKLARHGDGLGRVSDDDGNDGVIAFANIQSQARETLAEIPRVLPEPLEERRIGLNEIQRRDGSHDNGGRQRIGEKI